MIKENILERLINKLDAMDAPNMQAYILRISKEKGFLETIFNTISEGIIVIDKNLYIKYHNKTAANLLGLPNDLKNVRISQFLTDINWHNIINLKDDYLQKVSRQEIEIFYPSRKYLQFYLAPHQKGQNSASIILSDITDSRTKTINEIETEKLHIVSLLAASVAHEIGNPLNSLSLQLQLLKKLLIDDDFSKEELLEIIEISSSEVNRLDNIISQFLTAVRPAKPILKPIFIKDVIIDSLNFMKQEIKNRSVDVQCKWPDFLPLILGDAEQLKQAFYNIIKNAIQAMVDGGELKIDCSYDDNFTDISFSDIGCGLSIESIGEIFNSFHTSKKTGTGLGLMIVERVVREHNAEIVVNSKINKGTSFIIRFPRNERRMRMLNSPKSSQINKLQDKV